MLTHLHIRDFAIVDQLELEFQSGMTVLTGETGAGKSILLDALGLTLGDRADSSFVRHGAERAEIIASFDVAGQALIADWLGGHQLEGEGGECLIRRTVGADGRSRGYINGRPAPVQLLKELGEQLVDIHGQHAHQYLLRRNAQRQTLDAFAGLADAAANVTAAYQDWRAVSGERETLSQERQDREARLELLRYQIEELEALDLSEKELADLDDEHHRLANVTRLQEGAQSAILALSEDEQLAAVGVLERIAAELSQLAGYDSELESVAELINGAAIQAGEAAGELRRYLEKLDIDPERLAEVEQRLDTLQDLARKHRCRPDQLPEFLEAARQERDGLEASETRLDDLDQQLEKTLAQYRKLAGNLSRKRCQAAEKLAKQVTVNMQELGMKGGHFEVEITTTGDEPAPYGHDQVQFLVTANPGQPAQPLQKVASGGELSRISLAIQVITAGREGIPTLIFDEVDVGVGGGVAEIVGRQLHALGEDRQVLCVTHQPQVASQGHQHLRIAKQTRGGTTRTRVEPLSDGERVEELARMLGGIAITDQTRSHAREMLTLASDARAKRREKSKV
ncbi:DNA repair protein RecN [Thiohalomonas denitrificans]|uniref:DNA repair protein RecN n=1 Tax=Thiohalomonas denitrificans TaxID=415747 RepID=A0A1G5PK35_9GAMM|nr:DNA repair protein RecN [Thiohalomonas denitrificans]SCZ49541.1 DNA replication and repair protein RecN [Thiohalomonas denitrificans]